MPEWFTFFFLCLHYSTTQIHGSISITNNVVTRRHWFIPKNVKLNYICFQRWWRFFILVGRERWCLPEVNGDGDGDERCL